MEDTSPISSPITVAVQGTVQWRPVVGASSPTIQPDANSGTLYAQPIDANKALNDDFLYWSGKLSDFSVQLSYAVIGGCWAVFKTKEQLLQNHLAKLALIFAIGGIAVNLIAAHMLSEEHRARVVYAENDLDRWRKEWSMETGRPGSKWPFGLAIVITAGALRQIKFALPLLSGSLFLLSLFRN